MKYNINKNLFYNPNTEEISYFIGFLFADGNNYIKANKITINLVENDIEILFKIREILESNHPIRYINRIGGKRRNQVSFSFSNKEISKKLEELGVINNKTKLLRFPNWLNEDMYSHFIRGYFDGDGSLLIDRNGYLQFNLVGTKDMLSNIKNIFEKHNTIKIKELRDPSIYKNNPSNIKYLSYSSYSANQIMNFLYKDSTIFLDRKKKVFDNFNNNFKN